jgi:hypothetical protein
VDRLVTILLAVGSFLVRLGIALGRRQGRTELSEEQRRIADAMREDFDRIDNDGRSVADAADALRKRRRLHVEPPTNVP